MMSRWSSFEQDQEYANKWHQYLEFGEIDESRLFKGGKPSGEIPEPEEGGSGQPATPPESTPAPAQAAGTQPQGKLSQAKAGAQKGAAGVEKARQAVTGTWDWIANFLSGTPQDKDHSHLKMPTPDSPTGPTSADAAGGDAEEDTSDEPTEPGTPPEEDTSDEPTETGGTQDKVISKVPSSAQGTSQSQSLQNPEQEKLAQWAAQQRRTAVAMADDREWHRRFNKEQEKWSEEQWKAWHASPALNESQTYDRWKVLSGIKKKVI